MIRSKLCSVLISCFEFVIVEFSCQYLRSTIIPTVRKWVIPPNQDANIVAQMELVLDATERKIKKDWALFIDTIASRHQAAEKITLVMNNLITQNPRSLYKAITPEKAKALWGRFEFVFTPKHGSRLNMAGIELRVLHGQCLNRWIPDAAIMRTEVKAWEVAGNSVKAKVTLQFTTEDARIKLKRLYPTLEM
jgi:hypothetical protein